METERKIKSYSIGLDNGHHLNTIHIMRGGRYSTYYITYEKGVLPQALSGVFLSLSECEKTLENYLKNGYRKRSYKSGEVTLILRYDTQDPSKVICEYVKDVMNA